MKTKILSILSGLLAFGCTAFKYGAKVSPFLGGTAIAQNFAFGTNTADNSAGIYETNSPTSIHPNRRYQILVNALEQHYRGRKIFFDTVGTKNFSLSANARLWISDASTGELKPCKLDSLLQYLNLNLNLPYSSITGTPSISNTPTLSLINNSLTAGGNTVTLPGNAFTISTPTSGNTFTAGTAFQPLPGVPGFINVRGQLTGLVGVTSVITVSMSATQNGSYTEVGGTRLLVSVTAITSDQDTGSIPVPAGWWVRVGVATIGIGASVTTTYVKWELSNQ